MKTPAAEIPLSPPGLKLARFWYLLGGLMLLLVGFVSLMPVPDTGVNDKFSHLVTYFILGGWFGLLAASRVSLGWTIVGLIAYGMLIELLQGMTTHRPPTRSGSIRWNSMLWSRTAPDVWLRSTSTTAGLPGHP